MSKKIAKGVFVIFATLILCHFIFEYFYGRYVQSEMMERRETNIGNGLCYLFTLSCENNWNDRGDFASINKVVSFRCPSYSVVFRYDNVNSGKVILKKLFDHYSFFKNGSEYSISFNDEHMVSFHSEGLTDDELLKKFVLCSKK